MIPKGVNLTSLINDYLTDCEALSSAAIAQAKSEEHFRMIFRTAYSFEAVLAHLATSRLKPKLNGVRALNLRLPALIALGQESVAHGELRRLLELIGWTVFFSDHPREWAEFEGASGKGFSQDPRRPISYAAHREASFYMEYAKELMESEPSGGGKAAVENLKHVLHRLNASIHPGEIARNTTTKPPFDRQTPTQLRAYAKLQKDALSNAAIVLCAFRRERFESLPAGPKAHLDSLISTSQRKILRSGSFGLAT